MNNPREEAGVLSAGVELKRTPYSGELIIGLKEADEHIDAPKKDQKPSLPEEKKLPSKNGIDIKEGDWVKIQDPTVAGVYSDGKAKVVLLLKGLIDSQGNPVIEPGPKASVREKTKYDVQLALGTRVEIRAVLYGLSADETRQIEYEKTVPTGKLTKIAAPSEEPSIKKQTAAKPKAKAAPKGNFAYPQQIVKEPEDETPRRRNRVRRREK